MPVDRLPSSLHSSNLVIVRAGDSSLHPQWLANRRARNWDLVVSYFGDDEDMFHGSEGVRVDSKGPKMPALFALISEGWDRISTYEYIWLPDDDLAISGDDITVFFSLCKKYGLALAQPSLTENSFVYHAITVHNPRYLLRFTNYVEMMAPCFSREALERCLNTFGENLSGWGQDHIWARLLCPQAHRLAVVDAVQMKHTRPFGGPNYVVLKERGISAEQELQQILGRYGTQREFLESIGAVSLNGEILADDEFAAEIDYWLTAPW